MNFFVTCWIPVIDINAFQTISLISHYFPFPVELPVGDKGTGLYMGASEVVGNTVRHCARPLSPVWPFATPVDCSPPGSSLMGILQARVLEWVAVPSSLSLPSPGIKPRSPALRADPLSSKPWGKPKNPGVGSLSLLQGIFPTQESTRDLLHCRWILYELSHPGSPHVTLHTSVWLWSVMSTADNGF